MSKIGIVGITGRMGRSIYDVLMAEGAPSGDLSFAGGSSRGACPAWLEPQNHLDLPALFESADCVIDFTQPEALEAHLKLARAHKTKLVIGTTGVGAEQEKQIEDAAKDVAIVYSANMSVGVNVLSVLVEQAARVLGDDFDLEIHEAHHKHKVDAPSGTALLLGRSAATGRGVSLEEKTVIDRSGARKKGDIGFSVTRGGDVAGEHSVGFFGDGERLELSHKASDRSLFAKGSLRAARWLKDKENGLFTMRDVLGL